MPGCVRAEETASSATIACDQCCQAQPRGGEAKPATPAPAAFDFAVTSGLRQGFDGRRWRKPWPLARPKRGREGQTVAGLEHHTSARELVCRAGWDPDATAAALDQP